MNEKSMKNYCPDFVASILYGEKKYSVWKWNLNYNATV